MEWSPTYSVKVKKFDDQHKKLVDLINQLHDAMRAGQGNAMLGVVLQQLISYASSHFGDEEKTMQTKGYPGLAAHKVEHEKFVAKVLDAQKQFQAGSAMLTLTVMNFLKDWLISHIKGVDQKYSEFLNSKGVV
jgi:hemerythrin